MGQQESSAARTLTSFPPIAAEDKLAVWQAVKLMIDDG